MIGDGYSTRWTSVMPASLLPVVNVFTITKPTIFGGYGRRMEIGPLTTRAVLTIEEDDSLRDAAVSMVERGVGSAVVVAGGKPVGIVTDRDVMRAYAQGGDGSKRKVTDYLSRRLLSAPPTMSVGAAAQIMRDRGFRHLVVVDDAGALVGVFSMRDLVVGLLQELQATAGAPA